MRDRFTMRFAAACACVALVAGCNDPTSDNGTPVGDTWEQETNFTDPNGGYSFEDESEAFGDPALAAIEIAEGAVAGNDPDSIPNDSTGAAFAVRIAWGQLRGNRDATATLDWTGSLHASDGTLAVVRVLAFERLQGDQLVLPRPDRQTIGFESQTRPSFDGLVVLVRPTSASATGSLTFTTGPLTRSWSYEELRGGEFLVPVDSLGNAVSVVGVRLPRPADVCARGFVRGHWLQRNEERGVLRGVWVSSTGIAVGHVRGHFGVTDGGDHVWFGKILGRGGRFLGIARGTYVPSIEPGVPGGTFSGAILVRPGVEDGQVGGRYLPGRAERATGWFEGRWAIGCTDPQ